jgi:signal transduction histidine kinase
VNPFRSVGARLSLALAAVVLVALGIVYVVLVPALQTRLVNAKLRQLHSSVAVVRKEYGPFNPDFVTTAAATSDAHVVLFALLSASPPTLQVLDDSLEGARATNLVTDPVALKEATTLREASGTVRRDESHYAEVAFPVSADRGVLLSASLKDAYGNVEVVRERLLSAGLIGLVVAFAVGFGGAAFFARRIRRLERAADRIAGGDFSGAVVDSSSDELGELARAFDRMRRQLAQLDDARRAFIANASHELRTPIFSLGGFLELLQDEDLDEATRHDFLATMRGQVERLTRLAADLLDLSRLDAGRLHAVEEWVDLAPLARSLAEEFEAVARAGSHPLEVSVQEAAALADPEHVLRIGRILLENALTHTPAGTPVLVRVRAPAELVVEDAGPGIPPEQLQQIFERFTRLDGVRASGSGLGLAIARELAALMGGSIRVESRPGRTVFALVLPAAALTELERDESLTV